MPSLTADFEFHQVVFRRFDFETATMLKVANFIGLILHLLSAFHPITLYVVFKLGVQKVFRIFSSSFVADPRNLSLSLYKRSLFRNHYPPLRLIKNSVAFI